VAEQDAFLAKSVESLASAGDDFERGRYNSCARNAYYAAFQAAVAALLHEGIRPTRRWEHEFVSARFAGIIVKRLHRYPSSVAGLLNEAFFLRVEGDYSSTPVGKASSRNILGEVRKLVRMTQEKINGDR
jgi:uncharacterized protein (UPF0332 family)